MTNINTFIKKQIENSLAQSEVMWNEGTSHATIVGFLEATLKHVLTHME